MKKLLLIATFLYCSSLAFGQWVYNPFTRRLDYTSAAAVNNVNSVFGRTGDVVGQSGDYSFSQISNLIGLTQLDPAIAVWLSGAGAPALSCVAAENFYLDTTNFDIWFCSATNTWRKILSTSNTGVFALTVTYGADPCGTVAAGQECISTSTAEHLTLKNSSGTISVVPHETATIDLTAQTAAITATALYTPIYTGLFRVSYYAKVTTAASVSSILGGTTGLVIAFTDGTDSVAQSVTMPEDNQAGNALSIGTGNTGNTTTTVSYGIGVINAKTAIGITYAFGYTSSGTAMAYELHIKLESL